MDDGLFAAESLRWRKVVSYFLKQYQALIYKYSVEIKIKFWNQILLLINNEWTTKWTTLLSGATTALRSWPALGVSKTAHGLAPSSASPLRDVYKS